MRVYKVRKKKKKGARERESERREERKEKRKRKKESEERPVHSAHFSGPWCIRGFARSVWLLRSDVCVFTR